MLLPRLQLSRTPSPVRLLYHCCARVRRRITQSGNMQPGAALQAVLLAVLLAGPRGVKSRLLSASDSDPRGGQLVCRGGTQRPCYKVIYLHDASRRLNFEEAKEACRRDGGHLVSIESGDEQRLIEKFIENLSASDGDFWIGLRRHEEKRSNSTACQDLYAWTDGSMSKFRNWYVDEPSCGSEVCVVMYHQPSAPAGIGGPYKFQWNDDRCNMKNNFICKYFDEKPTAPSTRPGGERTEPATPTIPEETQKEDAKETFKESKEASLNLAYILIPSIPLLLLLVVTTVICWVWIYRRRTREHADPSIKGKHNIWPSPHQEHSPDLEVYNVIRKQSEADLAEPRPDLKNISFRVCSGEATPDNMSCDYDNIAVNPSESGFVTMASVESGFVTNDIYEFSPDQMGRSKECRWVENEIYGY
ncbi:layilin isoform X1 [Marmota marmota marmota]|uniref:layilin isoform X1 n=2 Tax=Marmota marmota marmota TaxID=9994 RepID=UPI0007625803|nr:layilin isoform X1 [Marmota marmota marmota]